ncbi:MAG: sigma-70 family RNA polymerase sigma factor [Desulfomonile tiedjei]|nr:sigma-70 family RNA polymerase sigma factor [Desulfomonile tiedjei]
MDKRSENKDYLLVQECLRGSEEAWNEFYSRFIGLMRSVVRRRLNLSSSDVQDITQSAFLELTTALRNYDSEQPLRTFVCLVTERVLIDEYRKRKAAKRSADTQSVEHHDNDGEGTTMVPSDLAGQDEEMEKAELASHLRTALRELDEKCRELITLRYYNELPFSEIASMLDATENTVTVRIRRCLDKLRGIYGGL